MSDLSYPPEAIRAANAECHRLTAENERLRAQLNAVQVLRDSWLSLLMSSICNDDDGLRFSLRELDEALGEQP